MSTTASSGDASSLRKRIARSLSRRLRDYGAVAPVGFEMDAVPRADVALYFADGPDKLYQLTQWLPVFEAQSAHRSIVVLRQPETYAALQGRTSLQILLVPTYETLMALYDRADFHAVVYVNNGWTNFQSLAFQQAVHVHVNHGESDKICMVSNQAKAYDKVFVAGEAAVRRHEAALVWFDQTHLMRVGRPQLDLEVADPMPRFDGITITYAPTWEGEDEANDYTSVDVYGVRIIRAALAQPGARVAYKPHPRVFVSDDAGVRSAHATIVKDIKAAGGPHLVLREANILGVIRGTDVMISDVSSVTLDHLYLRPEAPIVLCDRRTSRDQLLADAPVAEGAHVLDESTIGSFREDLAALIAHDGLAERRRELRDYYFDGIAPGASTARFWATLEAAIYDHDAAIRGLSRVRSIETNGHDTSTGDQA